MLGDATSQGETKKVFVELGGGGKKISCVFFAAAF